MSSLSLLKINTQNLIHVNLLSIRLVNKTSWFSRCTSARTKRTSTIPLIQLFVLHIQLPPDNVICQINVELEMVANLDFILHEYIQDTKKRCKFAARTTVAAGSSSACSVQKLTTTLTCLQRFKMKTWWLQQTLQRQRPKLLRDEKRANQK